MPIKKGKNRRWWEPRVRPKDCPDEEWHYYERETTDEELRKLLRYLSVPDARRLAEMIYNDLVEIPRRHFKSLRASSQKRFGRWGRKPGPKKVLDPVEHRRLREVYRDILKKVRSGADAKTLSEQPKLSCTADQVRWALANRRGVKSKARGILLAMLYDKPSASDDDYLRRFLVKTRPRLVAPKARP